MIGNYIEEPAFRQPWTAPFSNSHFEYGKKQFSFCPSIFWRLCKIQLRFSAPGGAK
jgi:hypothetical protein